MLSTSHTNFTQQSQPQNYDPPAIPLQLSTQINTHNSPQQGSSNPQHTNTVRFQTPTPPSPPEIQNTTYTPAQNNPVQKVQTGLNINTIHSNPPSTHTTSRNLSRPRLQPILTNTLSYNLTSTNPIHTQQSQTNNNQSNPLNTFPPQPTLYITTLPLQNSHFQVQNPLSTTIRTNPHFHNTSTTSFTNNSNVPTYNTVPPSTISHNTISHPKYINSSTSISDPIKPFDGLDHNHTPEEYLQHIDARVTLSLGLQPTSVPESEFWHARLMVLIQCSLTGTALAGIFVYTTLINKIGTLLCKLSKNNSHLKRTLIMLKLKPLIYPKRTMKQYVTLHLKFNSWLKKAGVMRTHLIIISNVTKFLQKDFPKTSKSLQIKDK